MVVYICRKSTEMTYKIKQKKLSDTKKWYQADIALTDFWGAEVDTIQVRIVARFPMEQADIKRAIEEAIRRKDVADCKTNKSEYAMLVLHQTNGNAFIKIKKDNADEEE